MQPSADQPSNNKRRSSKNSIKLIIWLVVFVLIVASGGYFAYKLLRKDDANKQQATLNVANVDQAKLNPSEKQAYDKVQGFFETLKAGNYTSAYDAFGEELKKQYPAGLNDFTTSAKNSNLQAIKQWAITSVELNGNKDRIVVKGSAIFDTPNPKAKFEFSFYKAPDGNFKIFAWQIYPDI